jgi:hypothetical protein
LQVTFVSMNALINHSHSIISICMVMFGTSALVAWS